MADARELTEKGFLLARQGKLQKALSVFEKAFEKDPGMDLYFSHFSGFSFGKQHPALSIILQNFPLFSLSGKIHVSRKFQLGSHGRLWI